jgi:hypothetical protein
MIPILKHPKTSDELDLDLFHLYLEVNTLATDAAVMALQVLTHLHTPAGNWTSLLVHGQHSHCWSQTMSVS